MKNILSSTSGLTIETVYFSEPLASSYDFIFVPMFVIDVGSYLK